MNCHLHNCTFPLRFFCYVFAQISDISLEDYIAVNPAKHATYVPHTAGRYSVKRFRKAQCPIVERLTNSLMMHGRNNGKKLMAVRIIKHAMEIIHLLTEQNPIQVIVDAVINRYGNGGLFPWAVNDVLPFYELLMAFHVVLQSFFICFTFSFPLSIIFCYYSGPREDATRIGSAGVVRRQAVDISPLRRINQAIYLLTTGARESAFRNIKTIAECLADELINAAKGSSNRYKKAHIFIPFIHLCSLLTVCNYRHFSYAIKKKDEIERVAKANRWVAGCFVARESFEHISLGFFVWFLLRYAWTRSVNCCFLFW